MFLVYLEWIVFLGKCIEYINTLCIYHRTKSVGYRQERQKVLIKPVNMELETQDIIPLLLIFY